MDRKVQKKNRKLKMYSMFISVIVVLGVLLYSTIIRKKTLTVEKNLISIREVKKGEFEDMAIFTVKAEPLNSVFINITEGGSIKEVFVEDGAMVEKGQPLLSIYNPSSDLNYMQQETATIEQINNLRNLKINLRNQELNLEKEKILIQHDYTDATEKYRIDSVLYKKEILSTKDYNISKENYRYQKERRKIIQNSVNREKKESTAQINRINNSLILMEKSLEALLLNKQNFIVKAPISGRLSSFNPTLGQTYKTGESIGKIDDMQGYKLVAQVDEFYIAKLYTGIKGVIDMEGVNHSIVVSKILSEVVNGKFKVEMKFENQSPEKIKMGMSFSAKLFLSDNTESLIIPKGAFYSETSGNWIFVLTGESKAERREISLGRENPTFYEVASGLKEGEKIITSSYMDYKNIEVLNLK